jgi:hypothetical protein
MSTLNSENKDDNEEVAITDSSNNAVLIKETPKNQTRLDASTLEGITTLGISLAQGDDNLELLPSWVKALLPAFRFIKKDKTSQTAKYHLVCKLCESESITQGKSNQNVVVMKDKQSKTFIVHLSVRKTFHQS